MPALVIIIGEGGAIILFLFGLTQVIIPTLLGLPNFWWFSRDKRKIVDAYFGAKQETETQQPSQDQPDTKDKNKS